MVSEELRAWAEDAPLTVSSQVSRGDIARFAVAIGASDAIHFDPAAARGRGFADVLAPTLFYVCLRTGMFNLVPQPELHDEGTPLRDIPPLTFTQALAGETRAELCKPFVAGDVVTAARRVESVFEKEGRSGPLTFVQFEYRYADPDDQPFAVEHFTRVFR